MAYGRDNFIYRRVFTRSHEERNTTMQKHTQNQRLRAKVCLLVLTLTLFIAGCDTSGGYPTSPNSTPQPAPTKNGYSVIYPVTEQLTWLQHVLHMNPGR